MRGSDEIFIDGSRFISASRAAKEFGFVRDYIAQLCRQGILLGQQVDSNWYVDPQSLQQFLDKREERQKRRNEELRRAFQKKPQKPDLSPQENVTTPRTHALTLPPPQLITHARKRISADRRARIIEHGALSLVLVLAIATNYAVFDPVFAQKFRHDIAAASAGMRQWPAELSSFARAPHQNVSALSASAATGAAGILRSIAAWIDPLALSPTLSYQRGSPLAHSATTSPPVRQIVRRPVTTTIINNPIVERVVETQRIIAAGGISEDELSQKLNQLDNKLSSQVYSLSAANSSAVVGAYQAASYVAPASPDSDSTFTGGTITSLSVSGTATSTFAGGINVTGGCVTVNGTCLGTGSGSGNPGGSDTQVQFNNNGNFAGTSTFTFASSTNLLKFVNSSSTLASVFSALYVGDTATTTIKGSATSTFGAGIQATAFNLTSATATSTAANGFNLSAGCFAMNGTCITGGGSSASSTLLSDNNTWSGLNLFTKASTTNFSTFGTAYFGGSATTTIDSSGNLSVAGSATVTGKTTLGAASTTNLSASNAWLTGQTASSLLALDQNNKLIATSTIGWNLLKGPASSIFAFDQNGTPAATTSIGVNYLTGVLAVGNGGTGASTFSQGWLYSNGGASALAASTSPTVNYITATSTIGTNTFAGGLTVSGNTTLASATTTSLFSTTASSTNLFSQTASVGSLALLSALPITSGGTNAISYTQGQLLSYDGTRFVSTSTIGNNQLANSTVGATSPNSTLSLGAAAALGSTFTADLNLGHSNWWTATQNFTNASTSQFTATSSVYFTALTNALLGTDQNGKLTATSTISSNLLVVPANSVLAGNSSGTLIASSTIGWNLLKGPASSLFAFDASGNPLATTSIGVNYLTGVLPITSGGTNATSFTTGQPIAYDGTRLISSSTLAVAYGGTGWGNIVANTVLLGNGAGALATTTAGTNGQVLALVSGVPTWVATTTLSTISGTLGVGSGGTGSTTLSGIIVGNGTNAVNSYGGTSCTNQFVRSLNGSGVATCATVQNTDLANSTIGATSPNSTLSFGAAAALGSTFTADLNLAHSNWWTATENFTNASTSQFTATSSVWFTGTTASSLLALDSNNKLTATSTIGSNLLTVPASSILAGNSSGTLIASSTIGWNLLKGPASSIFAFDNNGTPLATTSIGVNYLTGILSVGNGGTGWSNIAAGAIPYGNGSSALATTSTGTAGYVLAYLNGVPTWTATTTLSTITGTLAVGNGGTGSTTLSGIIVGNGTSAVNSYGGTSCTSQFVRSLNGSGLATCATVQNTDLANSTIGATSPNSTLTLGAAAALGSTFTADLNLGHSNWWTATQNFTNSSTSQFTATSSVWFTGTTASSLLALDNNNKLVATSSIGSNLLVVPSNALLAGNSSGTLIASSTIGWNLLKGPASSLFAFDQNGTPLASTSIGVNYLAGVIPIANGGTNNSAAYTAGSVIYSNGTSLTQDNSNFFWDSTNHRLGIGNTSPTYQLEVASTTGEGGIVAQSLTNSDSTGNIPALMVGQSIIGGVNSDALQIGIYGMRKSSNGNASMAFYTGGDAFSEKMRIDTSGNVGIGTTSPTGLLTLTKTNSNTTGITSSALAIDNPTGSQSLLNFSFGGTAKEQIRGDSSGNLVVEPGGTGDMYLGGVEAVNGTPGGNMFFYANNAERMRINTSGNIMIGTTTQIGNGLLSLAIDSNARTGIAIKRTNASPNGSTLEEFQNYSGTGIGTIAENGSNVAYNTSSDRRIKENIATTTVGLATLMQVPVEDFSFISDATHTRTQGFIAQDLYKLYPYAVTTNGDNGIVPLGATSTPWGVDYGRITPLIVKAVQDIANLADSFKTNLIAWFASAENGITDLFAQTVHAKQFCAQKSDATEVCVNGDQLAAMLAGAGAATGATGTPQTNNPPAAEQSHSTPPNFANPTPTSSPPNFANPTPAAQPPVIALNGENPTHIHVGDSYSDLGATITAPDKDKNLGIKTYLNGALVSNIVLDTSAVATDTIDYVATDQTGLAATSTRTVIIELGTPQLSQPAQTPPPAPPPVASSTPIILSATSTATTTVTTTAQQ